MGWFAFTKRDIIVLVTAAWAVGLIYSGYLLVLKVQDIRREAIIDANRTRNDIVIDNERTIRRAIYTYAEDHDNSAPLDLEKLVDKGYLRRVPINPFTGQPTKLIRIGEYPYLGEVSASVGKQTHGPALGAETVVSPACLTICYGVPEEGCNKYSREPNNTTYWGLLTFNQYEEEWLSTDFNGKIITMDGPFFLNCKRMGSWSCDPIEQVLIADGYTLPIEMDQPEVVAGANQ